MLLLWEVILTGLFLSRQKNSERIWSRGRGDSCFGTPYSDVVHEFAAGARNRGVEAIIAAAGAAAHLGGVIAAYTTVPVIGIPINATPLNGMDALLSFVQMPAGIPVATMAINGAKNAALFAVQILSVKYPELVTKLAENRLQMQEEVKAKGEKLAKMRAEGK